jgi:stage V sporulation protein S
MSSHFSSRVKVSPGCGVISRGAIAGIVRQHHRAEIQAIGAGAINQAVKAMVLATGYLRNVGIFVSFVPEFADVTIEENVRTAVKLVVEPTADSNFSANDASGRVSAADLPQV